jgi:hypothetical protein
MFDKSLRRNRARGRVRAQAMAIEAQLRPPVAFGIELKSTVSETGVAPAQESREGFHAPVPPELLDAFRRVHAGN